MNYLRSACIISMVVILPSVAVSQNCPDFSLPSMEGSKFILTEQLKEGPVLIDFWATWCKPCLQELPELEKIHKEFGPKGLQVVAITIDNPRSQAKVRPFIRGTGYTFNVLLDGDMRVRKLFGGTSVPLTALVLQSGEIAYQHLGYVPGDEVPLIEAIRELFPDTPDTKDIPEKLTPDANQTTE